MHPFSAILNNPVKVSVGVLLVILFGSIALMQMPMQLTPDVQRPTISVNTRWPGASPHEIEKEIVQPQEEMLKSVKGISKMSAECQDSSASITLEFGVGTNMQEAVLQVNTQLQQVRQYPIDADQPTINTSSSSDRPIAWFILSARPASDETIQSFADSHPKLQPELERILKSPTLGLKVFRLTELAKEYPEAEELLPANLEVPKYRKFARDRIESQFERVSGVANANVRGGQEPELQILVDPEKLAARGLTLSDIRRALSEDNKDFSAGDFWEGKRRYIVRTLGEFRTEEQVENQIIYISEGKPVYISDVAEVRLKHKKPTGFVRRFGVTNISINCQRESNANVIQVMAGLQREMKRLNDGILKREGLILTQVYDETDYINSALDLVNQNIILGSALTIIVLMLFLHMSVRTLIVVPILAGSAIAAVAFSPWIFLVTLAIILVAGFLFARGSLVVAIAIPTSLMGTFLILNGLGRSLNVISLAGLAFAVGMLVDNAVVVLENIHRYHQMGQGRMQAALAGVKEVWGAVLASTLTTLAVFLPVIFLQGEVGQLFLDIAIAISGAVGFSLLVSVLVIPVASSSLLENSSEGSENSEEKREQETAIAKFCRSVGTKLSNFVVYGNQWIQQSVLRQIGVIILLLGSSLFSGWLLLPKIEYLPQGNRNLIFCMVLPPPGYNVEHLGKMGEHVEKTLRPYWDFDPENLDAIPDGHPAIGDFFYVARSTSVFIGIRAHRPSEARKIVELIRTKLQGQFPGSFVTSFQSSLFGRGLSGGRAIDVEITGPELEKLVQIGGRILGQSSEILPEGTQARPVPSLDLSNPEIHVTRKSHQAKELGISNAELGYAVNALIDGAYVSDYYVGGEKIDMVVLSDDSYQSNTQNLETQYISTRNLAEPVRLDSVATVSLGSGPQQIAREERQRAITIQISPSATASLEETIDTISQKIVRPLEEDGTLGSEYQIHLSGTADKLKQTWQALRWNILLAVLITYLLLAALFESWSYPLVIILSVPIGAVGGIFGLRFLGLYLQLQGTPPQLLDVLTMLGFIILVGTVVNNAILIVHQSLTHMKEEGLAVGDAISASLRSRIRPIFMTTLTTVFGLSPLVFFPGSGSELYRGLGSVVLGGLLFSTIITLFLVPTLFSLFVKVKMRFTSN